MGVKKKTEAFFTGMKDSGQRPPDLKDEKIKINKTN